MRIVFMGTPEFAVPSLRALAGAGYDILAVVTQPDRPRRRRSSPAQPSPVKAEAVRRDLPVLQPESVKEPAFVGRVRDLAADTIVVVAYGQILPPEVLAIPPRWCINLHASILPKYRGAAPIARAILAGEKVTGVTTMKMDRGLDTGDILLQKEAVVGLAETAGELTARLADLGADVLRETLDLHARGGLEPRRQDAGEATQAPPLTRADGRIDWSAGAQEIVNRVRACNPWPLATTFLGRRAIRIVRAEMSFENLTADASRAAAGHVIAAEGGRILVRCRGVSRLAILEIGFPDRRTMSAREAINGRLIRAGEIFTSDPTG
ncbi:MAG: methionyl-tRNA formyltransferase [Acidobacteria bacterium]|nr:MAG: methionyl-tRNA formyltransferase [Acidobacteriota bacterium]